VTCDDVVGTKALHDGERNQVAPIARAQLHPHVFDVSLDRVGPYTKIAPDLLGRLACA
jgi:hypothetical protein